MTASLLLFYITVAMLLQLAVGVGIAGWRLRHATPGIDCGLDVSVVSGAWPGWRQFRVERRAFEDAGCTQCSFDLKPIDGVTLEPFKPGQFITVRLAVADAGAATPDRTRTVTRCYSLSDRPNTEAYRITVKRVTAPRDRPELPPGIAAGYLHDRVHEGDIIEIKAPAGQFFLDPDLSVPAILVAGGIGVTPMMSMLRWCLDMQPERSVYLFYGVRHGREQAFKQTLEALAGRHPNFQLNVLYSSPGPDDVQGRDFQSPGHIDVDLLKRALPHGRHQFYVCGPPPMMESLVSGLRAWGVLEEDIHFEAFGPASARSALGASQDAAMPGAARFEVKFSRSGRTLTWDGQDANLLDFSERHGIAVNSGCRSGSCGSCEIRLVSGLVHYAQQPDHDIADGNCLLCVGTPASPLLLGA